ncbi:hypothetical protein [Streptomyces thermolilacinus]|uniref:hypothetical protein n=1 Tax=Streptomyces thermolilacinus TaxID=285540 RepID=UPI0033E95D3E
MTAPTSMQWVRAAAGRLTVGSERLAATRARAVVAWVRDTWARTMGWLGEASGIAWAVRLAALLAAAWMLRKIGVAVGGAAARRLDASPWLMWPALALWIIAAWRAGHPDKDPSKPPEAPPAGTPKATRTGPAAGLTVDQIRALLHAAFRTDDQAHVAVLADRLTEATGRAWTAADVRAAAETAGARVEKNVRMPGHNPSTGIRRSTLPDPSPTPPPGPVDGVVVAGQPTPTEAATTTATPPADTPREGVRVEPIGDTGHLIVRHPADAARRHTLTPGVAR